MARAKAAAHYLRFHLAGQSVAPIDGRDFYIGKHHGLLSLAPYAVLVSLYQAGGMRLPDGLAMAEIDQLAHQPFDRAKLGNTITWSIITAW